VSELTDRFDALWERLERAVLRSGRAPGSVTLTAVSKTYGADVAAELVRHQRARSSGALCGERVIFGESYMQEATAKMAQVADLLTHGDTGQNRAASLLPGWHFIGGLQRRKAGDAVGRFELIHSLDSVKLAAALQKAWEKQAEATRSGADGTEFALQDVLVQVNVGRETQKSGVDPDGLEDLLNAVAPMRGLRVRGLMCVPPAVQESGASRPWFILLRHLRDEMEKRCGLVLPVLSMGMSDDFEEAVEEGATLVRIGSLIFGPRRRPGG
jgi:pyridoxal phosphate enzyme (YggS family)